MYVCLCNAITDRDLADAASEGVSCAVEAYRRRGSTPDCGRCLEFAQDLLDQKLVGQSAERVSIPAFADSAP